MSSPIIVQTSFPISFDCKDICKSLIDSKLAACIHELSPMNSYYSWENKLNIDNEYLLLIKTIDENFGNIEKILLEKHPYDVPEILSISISSISQSYLEWLNEVTN